LPKNRTESWVLGKALWITPAQHPQQKEQHNAAKKDEGHAHAGLAVHFGDQVGRGDIDGDAG